MKTKKEDGWSFVVSTDGSKFPKKKCNIISIVTITYSIFISIA